MSRRLVSSLCGAALVLAGATPLHAEAAEKGDATTGAVQQQAAPPSPGPSAAESATPHASGTAAADLSAAANTAASPAPAQQHGSMADLLSQEVRAVFKHVQGAVVKIEAEDSDGVLFGTGFFIDPNGTVLTSYSVGGETHDIIVSHGDTRFPATRLVADPRSGLALLKVESSTPFLPLGKSTDITVASPVLTVAYPMDMPMTPNFGLVGGWDIKYLGRYFATSHIRANVPVQRGEGGAPLLNMNGEVVGVVISSLDGGSSCFAVPVEAAEKIQKDYVRFGAVRPGWLGIKVKTSEESSHGSTAKVENLDEGSPADKAGIRQGDVLVKIGPHEIKGPEDVLNACFYLTAGDSIPVTVYRGEQEVTLKVEPEERLASHHKGLGFPGLAVSQDNITLRMDRQSPTPTP